MEAIDIGEFRVGRIVDVSHVFRNINKRGKFRGVAFLGLNVDTLLRSQPGVLRCYIQINLSDGRKWSKASYL